MGQSPGHITFSIYNISNEIAAEFENNERMAKNLQQQTYNEEKTEKETMHASLIW